MNRTSIEWTHRPETGGVAGGFTWNPIRARRNDGGKAATKVRDHGTFCTKISPGCANCYASVLNIRFGTGLEFTVPNLEKHDFYLDDAELAAPIRRKKPATIFVGDMFDLFHESIPAEFIAEVLRVALKSEQHTFQFLTKRADRMMRLVNKAQEHWGVTFGRHMWFGVSVESQPYADERIPFLLKTKAALRFLSVEPELESVMLPRQVFLPHGLTGDFPIGHMTRVGGGNTVSFSNPQGAMSVLAEDGKLLGIKPDEFQDKGLGVDWVICGGESGPGARPFNLAWAQSLLSQCNAAGVPLFMKQIGSNPVVDIAPIGSGNLIASCRAVEVRNRKGGTPTEWPASLRIREFPR